MYMQLNETIKRIAKFFLLWIVLIIVMFISWSFAAVASDQITQSNPPEVKDPAAAALAFTGVCVINAFLLSIVLWKTRKFRGWAKWALLFLYFFGIQFLLTQMETIFFSGSIPITLRQIASILLTGALMFFVTVLTGILLSNLLSRTENKSTIVIKIYSWKKLWAPVCVLIFLVYPFLYLFFGYFIAWQSEELRFYYTQSTELKSFHDQIMDVLTDGIYFFQILRGLLWVLITIPVALMLNYSKPLQYILIGILSALPAAQLLIPNPYMPETVAWMHFIETSLSNFIWGVVIVYALNQTDALAMSFHKTTEPPHAPRIPAKN